MALSSKQRISKMKKLARRHGWVCHYCGCEVENPEECDSIFRSATLDHKKPIARGGSNRLGNLALACYTCNVDKGDTPYRNYMAMIGAKGY